EDGPRVDVGNRADGPSWLGVSQVPHSHGSRGARDRPPGACEAGVRILGQRYPGRESRAGLPSHRTCPSDTSSRYRGWMTEDKIRSGRDTRLSAVIPCYREAESIPVMHERLSAVFEGLGVDWEIIFVDSGSTDNTPQVLAELAARDRRVTVVHHTRAFGSQS